MRFRLLILIQLSVIVGCGQPDQPASNTVKTPAIPPQIIVTSQPLLQMTQAIVGDAADVIMVVPADTSSRDWSPTADDVRIMQPARLILISGAGYEPWKDRVALPGSRMRDTAAGYYDLLIRIPDAVTHQHGPDGPHSHPGTVWATWLDPELCIAQLHQVSINCQRLLPDRKQAIESAEAKLSAELNTLNSTIASMVVAVNNEPLVVFADAPHYQYLVQRLGWTLHYLHWDAADTISETDRTELLDAFKSHTGIRDQIFLMDSRRSPEAEAFVRQSGGIVVRIDVCETASPNSVSLPDRMKQNLQRLKDGIAQQTDSPVHDAKHATPPLNLQ